LEVAADKTILIGILVLQCKYSDKLRTYGQYGEQTTYNSVCVPQGSRAYNGVNLQSLCTKNDCTLPICSHAWAL